MVDDQARAELTTDLDELFRQGARRMLAAALEAEAYITAHAELVDENSHRLVVRNGHAPGARFFGAAARLSARSSPG